MWGKLPLSDQVVWELQVPMVSAWVNGRDKDENACEGPQVPTPGKPYLQRLQDSGALSPNVLWDFSV